MKKFLLKYWLIIFLAFLASVLFFLKTRPLPSSLPQVISLSPAPNHPQEKTIKEIKITFNQPAQNFKKLISLITTPKIEFQTVVQGPVLVIRPNPPLQPGQRYLFDLYYQKKLLYSWQYRFATPAIPTPSKKEIGDPQIIKNLSQQTSQDFPLIKLMPYSDKDVDINYLSPRTLGIKIKNKTEKEAVKKRVLEWLEKNLSELGLPLDSHQLVWQQ
jgi:hypothetical protein